MSLCSDAFALASGPFWQGVVTAATGAALTLVLRRALVTSGSMGAGEAVKVGNGPVYNWDMEKNTEELSCCDVSGGWPAPIMNDIVVHCSTG